MKKLKIGILGTGNIGTDVLIKVQKSKILECTAFMGRNIESEGMKLASKLGINVFSNSIEALMSAPDMCDIVIDATTAKSHIIHAPILSRLNKFTIDLTPSRVGKMCIPAINLEECLNENNVNLITCGGQAIIPLARAISNKISNVDYYEIIATIASKSAGQGTRENIDEFTQTTKDALTEFTGVKDSKAIIIINPANPPITMRNTLYVQLNNPNIELIRQEVNLAVREIKKYVPGYSLLVAPTYENDRVLISVQVIGQGDYLPAYAGNLDIITCAAVNVAESYAMKKARENND